MPAFYFDTSAIVKRYHFEQGTEFLDAAFENGSPEDQFHTSFLTLLELTSAIERLADSGQLERSLVSPILARFNNDLYQRFNLWPISNGIIADAAVVVRRYKLRSADAIHLSTALSASLTGSGGQTVMIASDRHLTRASAGAGLLVLDPTADDALTKLREIRDRSRQD